jgi:hypothetical protein
MGRLFSGVSGHNVLQLGDSDPAKAPASITVQRLDRNGGDLVVDPSPGYAPHAEWNRRVTWDAEQMTVVDIVKRPTTGNAPRFRWHLATSTTPVITGGPTRWTIAWPDATMAIESDLPLTVSQEQARDNTLSPSMAWNSPDDDHLHACLRVEGPAAAPLLRITTRIWTGNVPPPRLDEPVRKPVPVEPPRPVLTATPDLLAAWKPRLVALLKTRIAARKRIPLPGQDKVYLCAVDEKSLTATLTDSRISTRWTALTPVQVAELATAAVDEYDLESLLVAAVWNVAATNQVKAEELLRKARLLDQEAERTIRTALTPP